VTGPLVPIPDDFDWTGASRANCYTWRCRYCGLGETGLPDVTVEAEHALAHEASCPQRTLPDDVADPGGFVLAVADEVEAYVAAIISGPLMARFILAQVALWRGIVERHVLVEDDAGRKWCRMCVVPDYPCGDLSNVVAAARAYLTGAQ
jgi:hypothetical protein